jgi:hypothetical protein
LISSMPSSRNDRLPMNEQRSGLRPASVAEKAAGRQDRGMPLHPTLTGRCSVRFDPPPTPPQTGWIWESVATGLLRRSHHRSVPARCDLQHQL